ncbi:LPXTG cell wall anchor domain-containing protein [Streptomyces sp. QL37]|uniref:LPXTG cell wall anchor domain-containing protein n=1 Tax=Streptomyces sp. QL37 TaxID=2093747 RepID=UPI000CF2011A|nr:LPXTG cell wall anchor domain-containing protein [Streptomyces sp. QL37]PPQ57087.1 peptidase [Streptomyces sp. QL37]
MKIRQILATAVAAAVTTPALLLSVTPAFADDKPAAQTQEKSSVAELEKAAAAAQTAYDDALAAEKAAVAALRSLEETSLLAKAAKEAKEAATEAATAKTAADQAVVDAEEALRTATDEEKAAKAAALAEAQAAAVVADEAKTAADAKVLEADKAYTEERIAAARAIGELQKATEAALADKNAADAALAKAKEEEAEGGEDGGDGGEDETCVPEAKLTTVVTGLPSTVVAGTKVNFKLRVTNGTDKTMDEVFPFVYAHATDRSGLNDIDHLVHLQWSSASSSKWKNVDNENYIEKISPLKAGAHADIKLRLTVDASAPAGNGVTFVAGDYWNDNGTCGGSPDLEGYEFMIAAAGSKPGKVDDAKPSTTKPNTSDLKPQSAGSASPAGGSLAATGSSDANSQLALASGAALAIGAGAMFVVRRRKAGSHA